MRRYQLNNALNAPVAVLAKRIIHPKDPPGQRSIYINPGDERDVMYRLLTFKDFPNKSVDSYLLARNGFYYTGYKDRAKCYSCGVAIEDWKPGSDTNFSNWHSENCQLLMRNEVPHLRFAPSNTSYERNETSSNPVTAAEVLMSNFSSQEQSSHSSSLPVFQNSQIHSTSQPSFTVNNNYSTAVSSGSNNTSNQRNDSEQFPCLHPINPHMRNQEQRLVSFANRAANWPAHRINATPREICEAGFFYLGERDRVKCWYCNGGLQNWEVDDNPWEEHAKWFPMCEFVLQQKGAPFVHEIVSRNPNLRRPTLYNPANIQFPNMPVRRNSLVGLSDAPTLSSLSGPEIVDPQQRIQEQEREIEQEMSSSDLVKQARLMGFDNRTIKDALKCQYQTHDCGFTNFETMVDALLQLENENNSLEEVQNSRQEEEVAQEELPTSSQTELKQLVDSKKCKICRKEEACIVFVPCGHLATCQTCGNSAHRCPLCRAMVKERIRSYLS